LSDAEFLFRITDRVATATINRPEVRNAVNQPVVRGLAEALRRAEDDESVAAFVITGAGEKAFCAGADLTGIVGGGAIEQHRARGEIGELFLAMRRSRLPIVARVNGLALAGGLGLVLACDLVVASSTAKFGTPEISLGLWPFVITALIQRDIPRKVALDLMLTGRRLSADEALHHGVINRVVEPAELDAAVESVCAPLKQASPAIAALGKQSFYRAEELDFDDSLDYLAGMLSLWLQSDDAAEGVSAFLEKRAPEWKGR
jgi:enoyl-CoA hydratase